MAGGLCELAGHAACLSGPSHGEQHQQVEPRGHMLPLLVLHQTCTFHSMLRSAAAAVLLPCSWWS